MTGFDSKRKAALDEEGMYLVHHTKCRTFDKFGNKVHDEDDDAQGYIAEYEAALQKEYQRGYDAGKAAQPEQEPVAWYDPTNRMVSTDKDSPLFTPLGQLWPLDVQRPWVESTGNEWFEWWRVSKVADETEAEIDFADFLIIAQAVVDKLKEDNK